jgi:hypothetical protein
MSERTLSQGEILDINKQLSEARNRYNIIGTYIWMLEQKLERGTTWEYEPRAFKELVKEVKSEVSK